MIRIPLRDSYFNLKINFFLKLKALLDLLCALGIHLSEIWTYAMKPPPNFSLYISALSAFFVHPSIVCFYLFLIFGM
jgi:hypothetical protein